MEPFEFSTVIPVYNEEGQLYEKAEQIFTFFAEFGDAIEIIFVNDGSTDRTESILKNLREDYRFKLISYRENRGKGYAVRQGVLGASGRRILFFDIDLATPLTEFKHLIRFITPDDHVVIGSRLLKNSRIQRPESPLRVTLGTIFRKLSNLFVPQVTDFTCGFKCFSREAARAVFSVAQIDRWAFDTEILYIAKLKNIKIREMPVQWSHHEDSRVRIVRAVFSSLKELCNIKLNQLKGLYDTRTHGDKNI